MILCYVPENTTMKMSISYTYTHIHAIDNHVGRIIYHARTYASGVLIIKPKSIF